MSSLKFGLSYTFWAEISNNIRGQFAPFFNNLKEQAHYTSYEELWGTHL
jgi:hypothetical protein